MTTLWKACGMIHNASYPPRRLSISQSTAKCRLGGNWFPRCPLYNWTQRGYQYRGNLLPLSEDGAILPSVTDVAPSSDAFDVVPDANAPEVLADSIDECSNEAERFIDAMPSADTFDVEIDANAHERFANAFEEADLREEANENRIIDEYEDDECSYEMQGLLVFKKWWYRCRVDISVNGRLLSGIPAFIKKDTLRVIGEEQSYIIPMKNVDYIGTYDGLRSIRSHFED